MTPVAQLKELQSQEDDYALLEEIDPSEARKPLCSRTCVLQLEEMEQQLVSAKAITALLLTAITVAEIAALAMIAFTIPTVPVMPTTIFFAFSIVLMGPALLSTCKIWEIAREIDVLKAIAVRPEKEDCYMLLEEKP